MAAARVADPAAVAGLRWSLAQALFDHGASEPVRAAFARYIADWSMGRVGAEWRCFGDETKAVLAARGEAPRAA
ncbi:MAG: hypothetical protein WDN44_02635 [Sphingomonas sp.]